MASMSSQEDFCPLEEAAISARIASPIEERSMGENKGPVLVGPGAVEVMGMGSILGAIRPRKDSSCDPMPRGPWSFSPGLPSEDGQHNGRQKPSQLPTWLGVRFSVTTAERDAGRSE